MHPLHGSRERTGFKNRVLCIFTYESNFLLPHVASYIKWSCIISEQRCPSHNSSSMQQQSTV